MPDGLSSEMTALIGDYFHAHAKNDRALMDEALDGLQRMLYQDRVDSTPFKDYFNNVYSDRMPYSTALSVSDYPRESVLRELLQNALGCSYTDKDMSIEFNFDSDDTVRINYNEDGFTLEQLMLYLSVGRSDGDTSREGRFGVGAKSVFMNVNWFTLRSGNFSFRMVNEEGTLILRELELSAPLSTGSEICFGTDAETVSAIKENLATMAEKKGDYINLVELCFAFIRKKKLGRFDEEEAVDRTLSINAYANNDPLTSYKIFRRPDKDTSGDPVVRFTHNGKSVIDFIWHENSGYVYLIPFAVSSSRRAQIAKVILAKYNYFSTYELTGLLKSNGEQFINQKLSAFFISVPNSFITSHRTGIKYECEEEIQQTITSDLRDMCDEYTKYFVLEIAKRNNSDKYYLRPKHFVFEFFANFVRTSPMAQDLGDKFQRNISIAFPNRQKPMTYDEMCEIGFFSEDRSIPFEMHQSGAAKTECIDERMEMLLHETEEFDETIVTAAYDWINDETGETGREFSYIFRIAGGTYRMDSEGNRSIRDYGLSVGFRSVVSIKLGEYVKNASVEDDEALIGAILLFDNIFGNDYSISMKYYQFVVHCRNQQFMFDVARMTVHNLKRIYDFIVEHTNRFENHRVLTDVLKMLVNSFTQGKDMLTFLREMKNEGAEITLQLDINHKYRFAAYGMQFLIPSSVTNKDMLEVVGDVYQLINCGMFDKRLFDFETSKAGYSFDKAKVVELLGGSVEAAQRFDMVMPKLYVCDLKIPRIALVGENDRVIRIIDSASLPTPEEEEKTAKYVLLKDGCLKPEFSGYLEFLLTGSDEGRLSRYFSCTEEPNRVILDQIPYYYKPLPNINAEEMQILKSLYRRIKRIDNDNIYRNYFSKDLNAKLFGYGGTCQCCPRESDIINNRTVKPFEVGIFSGESEKRFKFAMYLCSDDASASSGWIIEDLSIGGMNPFRWLEEINSVQFIPSEFMLACVKYRSQVTYDIAGEEDERGESIHSSTESELNSINIALSPLMAAKWIVDNSEEGFDEPVEEPVEEPIIEEPHEIKVLDLNADD